MIEFKKLSLCSICNHKLVYGCQDKIDEEIGIEGTYIAENDMKIKTSDIVDGVEFDICQGKFDNIECDGQHIDVDFHANRLHLIGFALWCNVYSVIKIVYSDGTTRCVKIPFINWIHTYEFNWLDIASVGGDVISHAVIASGKEQNPVFLHHVSVDIPNTNKIQKIILPENFCLHIFAITLEKTITSTEEKK